MTGVVCSKLCTTRHICHALFQRNQPQTKGWCRGSACNGGIEAGAFDVNWMGNVMLIVMVHGIYQGKRCQENMDARKTSCPSNFVTLKSLNMGFWIVVSWPSIKTSSCVHLAGTTSFVWTCCPDFNTKFLLRRSQINHTNCHITPPAHGAHFSILCPLLAISPPH